MRRKLSQFEAKEIRLLYFILAVAKETCYVRVINEPSQRRPQCFQLSSLFEQLIRRIDPPKIPGEQQNVNIEKTFK